MDNASQTIINKLIEADEPEEFIETWQELRPETATRIEQELPDWLLKPDEYGYTAFSRGNTVYEKRNGKWFRRRRQKNPAYFAIPQYFIMAPGPNNLTFLVVKAPRGLNTRRWQKACSQIYKDATGNSIFNVYGKKHWGAERAQASIDGTIEAVYTSRVNGEKPEPTYEIFHDGTWKRTSP
jgi:hypothetical protein